MQWVYCDPQKCNTKSQEIKVAEPSTVRMKLPGMEEKSIHHRKLARKLHKDAQMKWHNDAQRKPHKDAKVKSVPWKLHKDAQSGLMQGDCLEAWIAGELSDTTTPGTNDKVTRTATT